MKQRIAMAALVVLFCAGSAWADLDGGLAVGPDGLYVRYDYDNDTYILELDPADGSVTGYWDADRLSGRYPVGTIDGDVIFKNEYDRFYRYALPNIDGEELELVWEFSADGLDRLLTDAHLYRARRGNTVEVYALDTGEMMDEIDIDAEDFWGFSGDGFYATRDDDEELVYFDLSGEEVWTTDLERINYDVVFPIDGYVLLADKQGRELFCINDEGEKLWRQRYPWTYVPFDTTRSYDDRLTVMRAGDHAVFANMSATAFVDLETGDVAASTAPGFAEIPAVVSADTFVKISVIENYSRYAGPGDAVELFDLQELSINHLLLTPEPIVDRPRPTPAVDAERGILYLPLLEDRLIGVDIEAGSIVLDVTVELFSEDEEAAW
jgi:hypothetical protein